MQRQMLAVLMPEESRTASCWFGLALQERDKAMMLSPLTFPESEHSTKGQHSNKEETAQSALCLNCLASVPFFSPTLPPWDKNYIRGFCVVYWSYVAQILYFWNELIWHISLRNSWVPTRTGVTTDTLKGWPAGYSQNLLGCSCQLRMYMFCETIPSKAWFFIFTFFMSLCSCSMGIRNGFGMIGAGFRWIPP